MRTFKGILTNEFKVTVPDQFLLDMRHAAEQEDASAFLIETNKRHPNNDDAFIAAVLSNGIRHGQRHDLVQRFVTSRLSGTVAPGSITITEHIPNHDAPTAVPQVVKVERKLRLVSETPLADACVGRSHGGVD